MSLIMNGLYLFSDLGDVVEVLVAKDNFKILVKLLADLKFVFILKGLTAQTIFAPSDEAFSKLPEGTLEGWTTQQKIAIVLRHVVKDATILAANVGTKTGAKNSIKTLGGEVIDLTNYNDPQYGFVLESGLEDGVQISYKNNQINVVIPDVLASNGVIHIIDEVILPGKFPTLNSFLHFFQNQHI